MTNTGALTELVERTVEGLGYEFVELERLARGLVRVTIDTELRTAPFKTNLFDDRALTVPVLDEGEAVLEVKYDAFLPAPVRALLEGVTKQRCAVSKYTKCLDILE